jgi:alpha-N-arabinofuranosidase
MDGLIRGHRTIMDEHDPGRRVDLIVDEWGAWHKVEPGRPPRGLYHQNTVLDACVAALTLDIFNNRCAIVKMGNLAQLVNVLQALLLVDGDACVKTPTYHVFDLHRPHRGATALRLENGTDVVSDGGRREADLRKFSLDAQPVRLRRVMGSASVAGNEVCVTLCHTHPEQPCEAELRVSGGQVGEMEHIELTFRDPHDHNTAAQPTVVGLSDPRRLRPRDGVLRLVLRPGAVARLRGRFG